MSLTRSRAAVLAQLHAASRSRLLTDAAAWHAIEAAWLAQSDDGSLEDYVYRLGLVYSLHTGSMPGYSNGENETHFERFVMSIPPPPGIKVTRNGIKTSTRKLKRDTRFLQALNEKDET
jgi:hypothetical protein